MPATWKNQEFDMKVTLTGFAGRGVDGRTYYYIKESNTAVPEDELVFTDE